MKFVPSLTPKYCSVPFEKLPSLAAARFTPQQAEDSFEHPTFNAIRPPPHPKVLFRPILKNYRLKTKPAFLPCTPYPPSATLLRMKSRLPHAPSLALASLLPLTLLSVTAAAQDWAKARLDSSPRHREYVTLHHDNRAVQALVVYPEVKDKVPVVVMIHEIFG